MARRPPPRPLVGVKPSSRRWRPVWFGGSCSPANGRGVVDQSPCGAIGHWPWVTTQSGSPPGVHDEQAAPEPRQTKIFRLEANVGEALDIGTVAQGRRRSVWADDKLAE
jgi:hypothetical protein